MGFLCLRTADTGWLSSKTLLWLIAKLSFLPSTRGAKYMLCTRLWPLLFPEQYLRFFRRILAGAG